MEVMQYCANSSFVYGAGVGLVVFCFAIVFVNCKGYNLIMTDKKQSVKQKALDKLKELVGDSVAEALVEASKQRSKELATYVTKLAVYNSKVPHTKEFEKEVAKAMRQLGIVDKHTYNTVKEEVQNSEVFRWLVENEISDEELVEVLKKGLHAKKVVSVGGVPVEQDDHEQQGKFFDRIAKIKGYDVVGDNQLQFNINMVPPPQE